MAKTKANKIVDQMYDNDAFSKWLKIKRIEDRAGKSVLQMKVRAEMLNGFGIAHGGITYSLADSALAFASNARGKHAVSIETSISHTNKVKRGDVLTARATEQSRTSKIGIYDITIKNQDRVTVALFKGTVYRTNTDWLV